MKPLLHSALYGAATTATVVFLCFGASCVHPQPVVAPRPICDGLGTPPATRHWPKDAVIRVRNGDFLTHADGTRETVWERDVVLKDLAARAIVDELNERRDWDLRVALCLGRGLADGGVDVGN